MEEKRAKIKTTEQQELDKLQNQFDKFDQNVKDLTVDNLNTAPKQEVEQQTKLGQKDIERSKDIYLKPLKSFGPGQNEKFNEKFRDDYNFAKEYVQFIAENRMLIGEKIELWSKPFPGVNCDYWEVPVNKPVWGPRYLAEQIKKCHHHILSMSESNNVSLGSDGYGSYVGGMVAKSTIQRLDALPVSSRKSIFMGSSF